ncbi:DUF6644 family protein [Pseudomonas profundi]|uniref:DUF6644 family protein n=1 Tax=Pseudomonas profundi TaxID=1981513 RepID=UPI00123BB844|nr:DUF6644 family protein [Pseudomonas profundi]
MPEFWTAVSELPPAAWIRHSGTAYLLVNAAHILSLAYLVGNILTLDLRLLGIFRAVPLGAIGPMLSRSAACGLLLAMFTGAWLFSVDPFAYLDNPAFLTKLCLVLLGVVNAVWLHRRDRWRAALAVGEAGPVVRLHAVASISLWLGVVVAGRWIGFI